MPDTVTVWVVSQLLVVKLRMAGVTVAAPASSELTLTVTFADGSVDSLMVKVSEPASPTVSAVGVTTNSYVVACTAAARWQPCAVAIGVLRPHPHLVGRTLGKAGDRCVGGNRVLRAVGPRTARARPVSPVVAGDCRESGVIRRAPAHVEARGVAGCRRSRGAVGADGLSVILVTLIVTLIVSLPLLPSTTLTRTEWLASASRS